MSHSTIRNRTGPLIVPPPLATSESESEFLKSFRITGKSTEPVGGVPPTESWSLDTTCGKTTPNNHLNSFETMDLERWEHWETRRDYMDRARDRHGDNVAVAGIDTTSSCHRLGCLGSKCSI